MKKRTIYSVILIGLIYLFQIVSVHCTLYEITDPQNDVRHYQSATLIDTGDYHDEIDIINFEISDNKLTMSLASAPNGSIDHYYAMAVYWDGDSSSKNYTVAHLGLGINSVLTSLYDSYDSIIAFNMVPGVVSIVGNSVETPIPNFALIQNPSYPKLIEVYASFIVFPSQNYYADNLTDDNLATSPVSGYQFNITIITLLSLMIVPIMIIRRKK